MPDLSTSDSSNILAAASATQYGIVLDGAVPKRYLLRNFLRGGSTYNVLDYGATSDFSTDSTLAIQVVTDICGTNGGKCYFPRGHYKVSGPLINTSPNGSKPNSQIVIPLAEDPATIQNIIYEGEFWCNPMEMAVEHLATRVNTGVVIESTIDGTLNVDGITPAVFGSTRFSLPSLGDINFNTVEMYNLEIRVKSKSGSTHTNPTMSGVNARYISMFRGDKIKFTTQSNAEYALAPAIATYGLIMPRQNNRAIMDIGLIETCGYSYGVEVTEHTYIKNLWTVACGTAVVLPASYKGHQILIEKMHCEVTAIGVEMPTGCDNIKINSYGNEQRQTGAWYDYQYDFLISDSTSGNLYIDRSQTSATFGGFGRGRLVINTPSLVDHVKVRINTDRDLFGDQFTIDQTTPVWKGLDNGYQAQITLNGNKTIAVSYIPKGQRLRLTVIQDATGGRTLAFSGYTVTLATGTTIDTTASKATILEGYFDGTQIILYKVGGF